MSDEIDMICAVCSGTWGEPGFLGSGPPCPADCHNPAKWKKLDEAMNAFLNEVMLRVDNDKLRARIAELEGQTSDDGAPMFDSDEGSGGESEAERREADDR